MRPKAINVKILNKYNIEITFDNGEIKILDITPYFKFKIFQELKEKDNFEKVKVSGLSIEWENGADICPDELYNNSRKILEA